MTNINKDAQWHSKMVQCCKARANAYMELANADAIEGLDPNENMLKSQEFWMRACDHSQTAYMMMIDQLNNGDKK